VRGVDFLPLTVDYQEKILRPQVAFPAAISSAKVARPSARRWCRALIDRPVRGRCSRDGWRCEERQCRVTHAVHGSRKRSRLFVRPSSPPRRALTPLGRSFQWGPIAPPGPLGFIKQRIRCSTRNSKRWRRAQLDLVARRHRRRRAMVESEATELNEARSCSAAVMFEPSGTSS